MIFKQMVIDKFNIVDVIFLKFKSGNNCFYLQCQNVRGQQNLFMYNYAFAFRINFKKL